MNDRTEILPPHGNLPADIARMGCCMVCRTLTRNAELSTFGARCEPCYRRWTREPQPDIDVGDKREFGPKDWARALRVREEAGEELTMAQRKAWRAAMRVTDRGPNEE